jgi:hypothetical protein
MAVPITISQSNGVYSVSPVAPGSTNADAFQLTNNSSGTVTVYFTVCGNPASPFPASQDIAGNGGSYTTPTLNSGYVVFTIYPQGGVSTPTHVIHVGSTMHGPKAG